MEVWQLYHETLNQGEFVDNLASELRDFRFHQRNVAVGGRILQSDNIGFQIRHDNAKRVSVFEWKANNRDQKPSECTKVGKE